MIKSKILWVRIEFLNNTYRYGIVIIVGIGNRYING